MRDKNRIPKVLNQLRQIWEKNPDLRLGQLLLNVVRDPALYYIEDDELVARTAEFYGIKADDATPAEKVWVVMNRHGEFMECFRSIEKAREYALEYYERNFATNDRYSGVYEYCLEEFAEYDYISGTVYITSADMKG